MSQPVGTGRWRRGQRERTLPGVTLTGLTQARGPTWLPGELSHLWGLVSLADIF